MEEYFKCDLHYHEHLTTMKADVDVRLCDGLKHKNAFFF